MKKLWQRFDFTLIDLLAAVVFIVITAVFNWKIAVVEFSVLIVLFALRFVYQKTVKEKILFKVKAVEENFDYKTGKAFSSLTVACVVVYEDGEILWFNDTFRDQFSITPKTPAQNLKVLLKRDKLDRVLEGRGFKVRIGNHYYAVYSNEIELENEKNYLLYFFDETELRLTEKEYYETRPSVMLAVIDNADEIYQEFKESACTAILSALEQMVEDWVTSFGGLCRKFSSDRMLILVEERSLQKMIADKFSILDRVRSFTFDGKETDLTLSIGVGKEESFADSNNSARQALDMAQSRGGDQVAIRHEAQYKFYGGVSGGFERKKNKSKARLIAKTISELIVESENVLIMGHRFSDYDAIGSAIGLHAIATHFGKRTHIVIDRETTLSTPMVKQFERAREKEIFVSPERAATLITEETLLFVVDTHKKDFTEAPGLLSKGCKTVVIDHHRKSVDYIENAVVFYHSPTASSASEMVTELAQYLDKKPVLDQPSAQALFAGIMLDTRNFVIRTGVRTFEAAAYLRSRAANTVEAKKLFSNDMDVFRHRNQIIDAAARFEEHFAISVTEAQIPNLRLITSQAADEMLNIDGIRASFVLFRLGEQMNISARSYGEVNVQLIMEALGGGGHQTMAACQLSGVSAEQALQMLQDTIRQYTEQ